VSLYASVPEQVSAHAFIEYWFEVVGPPHQQVGVTITGKGSVSSGGFIQVNCFAGNNNCPAPSITEDQAQLYTSAGGGTILGHICRSPFGCGVLGFSDSFSVAKPVSVTTDTAYDIQLILDELIPIQGTIGGNVIEIDPTVALTNPSDKSKFQLVFSPGVGNGAADVPVPAALPLFATGLSAMGLFGWRRKRRAFPE
jgi:hypothetical protein